MKIIFFAFLAVSSLFVQGQNYPISINKVKYESYFPSPILEQEVPGHIKVKHGVFNSVVDDNTIIKVPIQFSFNCFGNDVDTVLLNVLEGSLDFKATNDSNFTGIIEFAKFSQSVEQDVIEVFTEEIITYSTPSYLDIELKRAFQLSNEEVELFFKARLDSSGKVFLSYMKAFTNEEILATFVHTNVDIAYGAYTVYYDSQLNETREDFDFVSILSGDYNSPRYTYLTGLEDVPDSILLSYELKSKSIDSLLVTFTPNYSSNFIAGHPNNAWGSSGNENCSLEYLNFILNHTNMNYEGEILLIDDKSNQVGGLSEFDFDFGGSVEQIGSTFLSGVSTIVLKRDDYNCVWKIKR